MPPPSLRIPLLPNRNLYVIYYGPLVDRYGVMTSQALQIIAAKPQLIIVPSLFSDGQPNLTYEVYLQFKNAGIKVLSYTWTKYGNRSLSDLESDIDRQMAIGVDGIFIDEVTNIETDKQFNYYSSIYHYIKSLDGTKLVIMNPGHYKVSERIMQIADIVSLEEDWIHQDQIPWKTKYPAARFMGVSSNEYCNQCISESNAVNKTLDAWGDAIGYHFATDKYIDLPNWFGDYISQLKKEEEVIRATGSTTATTTIPPKPSALVLLLPFHVSQSIA